MQRVTLTNALKVLFAVHAVYSAIGGVHSPKTNMAKRRLDSIDFNACDPQSAVEPVSAWKAELVQPMFANLL